MIFVCNYASINIDYDGIKQAYYNRQTQNHSKLLMNISHPKATAGLMRKNHISLISLQDWNCTSILEEYSKQC